MSNGSNALGGLVLLLAFCLTHNFTKDGLWQGNVLFLVVLLRVKGLTLFKQCILEVQFKFAISLSDKKAVDGSSLEVTGARGLLLVALSFAYFCPLALSLPL